MQGWKRYVIDLQKTACVVQEIVYCSKSETMKKLFPFLTLLPLAASSQLVPDTTFGTNGFSYIDWPASGIANTHAQLQSDGKIVISGNHVGTLPREGYVLRLNADGMLDTTYAVDGYDIIPNQNDDIDGPDIYMMPDDRLIRYTDNVGPGLVKVTMQGFIDTSFQINAGYGTNMNSHEFTMMDPARNYFYFLSPFPLGPTGLQRVDAATGQIDTNFGDAVNHKMPLPSGFNSDSEAAVQPDGKIVVICDSYEVATGIKSCHVKRLMPDGTFDTTFGTDGAALLYTTTETFSDREECMALDTNGSLYVGSRNWNTFDESRIYKLDTNGQPVTSFWTDGKIVLPDNYFILDVYAHAGNIYALGRKIYGLFKESDLMIAKFSANGVPDTGFGENGIYVEVDNSRMESGEDLVFTAGGGIIVAGETYDGTYHNVYAVKYLDQALRTETYAADAVAFENPVSNRLTLQGKDIASIALFSMDGRHAGFADGNTIAAHHLSSGLYLAKVTFTNGNVKTIKIVKR